MNIIITTQSLNSHHNCKLNFSKDDDQHVTKRVTSLHRDVKKLTVGVTVGERVEVEAIFAHCGNAIWEIHVTHIVIGEPCFPGRLPPGAPSTHESVLESLTLFSSVEWELPS